MMVEHHQGKLVRRREQLRDEVIDRLARFGNASAVHVVAGVEQDAEAHRHAFAGEERDGLELAIFVHVELLTRQIRYERPSISVTVAVTVVSLTAVRKWGRSSGFSSSGCWARADQPASRTSAAIDALHRSARGARMPAFYFAPGTAGAYLADEPVRHLDHHHVISRRTEKRPGVAAELEVARPVVVELLAGPHGVEGRARRSPSGRPHSCAATSG